MRKSRSAPRVPSRSRTSTDARRLSHAEHFADQRAEHRGRPAELPGQDRPELLCMAVGRGVIQELLNPADEDERTFLIEAQHPELDGALRNDGGDDRRR